MLQGDKWDPLVRLAAQYEAHPQKFHEMAQTSARLTLSRPQQPDPRLRFRPWPQMGFRMTMRAACDGRCWSWAQPRRVEAQESPDGMHARITYRGILAST